MGWRRRRNPPDWGCCCDSLPYSLTSQSYIQCHIQHTPNQTRGSRFVRYQELRVQELPDQVPMGAYVHIEI